MHRSGLTRPRDPALPRPGNGPLGEDRRTRARPRRQTMGGLVPARDLARTRKMTVSAETRAYWQELGAYYAAAERNGTDHTHPLKAPTVRSTARWRFHVAW